MIININDIDIKKRRALRDKVNAGEFSLQDIKSSLNKAWIWQKPELTSDWNVWNPLPQNPAKQWVAEGFQAAQWFEETQVQTPWVNIFKPETPAEPTVDEPVVDGSDTTWWTPAEDITPAWFTLDEFNRIADKPASQRTEAEKQFLLNLNTRFSTGQINRESFFKWDTWGDWATPSAVSTEASLDMADRILSWDTLAITEAGS